MTKTPHTAARSTSRTALMRIALFLLLPLGTISSAAFGQALPAAEASPISTGFELPRVAGSLQFGISVNESISDGYYSKSGAAAATGLNGDLAYISNSKTYPFSMVFSGGDYWSTSGQPSTLFLNLALSQVITTRNWSFILSDSVSYLPQTPSTGISGVPGTGDLGVPPVEIGDQSVQGVLTGNATRVSNVASLSAQSKLTGKTSLQFSGTYSILRFVGNSSNGLNNTGESGSIGLNHRIDERNSLSANYSYTQNSYASNQPGFVSQTATMAYTHQFSRKLGMNLSAGPQFSSSTNANLGTNTTPAIPSTINLYANVNLNYSAQFADLSLGYSRSTNGGFGVIEGARSDSVNFRASRSFARVWNGAVTAAYTRTSSLQTTGGNASFTPQTVVGAAQISRAIGRSISAYASYTLENQATPVSTTAVNAFSGFFQVASFGLTYSPSMIHFGPR